MKKNISRNIVVAMDIGASSGKFIAGYLENNKLHTQEIHRFENTFVLDGKYCVWQLDSLVENLILGLKQNNKLSIKSIGIDTWGVDYILCDENGRVLDKAYSYRDHRTDDVYERTIAELGKEYIYKKTGVHFYQFNTLYQLKAHMEENPKVLEATKYILMLPDYLHYKFSGVFFNEQTFATTTQMLNYESLDYDTDLLSYIGITRDKFPRMLNSGTVLGSISKEMQEHTGLQKSVLVTAPGSHDTASAIAAFFGDSSTMYISSGTWSIMAVETDSPIISANGLAFNVSNQRGVSKKNTILKNIMGLWLIDSVKREIANNQSFECIAKAAAKIKPFSTIINPNAPEFLNPNSMVQAIQEYARSTKQKIPTSIAELSRCVYDSLALMYNKVLNDIQALTKQKYTCINITGGGSKNSFLNQLTANILQRKLIAGPVETSALGNLIVQMRALGWVKDLQEGREIIKQSVVLEYYYPEKIDNLEHEVARFETMCSNDSSKRIIEA